MLKLCDRDFKEAIIKENHSMSNYKYTWNKWKKNGKFHQEMENVKMSQVEILKLKNKIIEIKSPVDVSTAEWGG